MMQTVTNSNYPYRADGREEPEFNKNCEQGARNEYNLCTMLKSLADASVGRIKIDDLNMKNRPGSGTDYGNKKNELDALFTFSIEGFTLDPLLFEVKVNPCHVDEIWEHGGMAEQRTVIKIDSLNACLRRNSPILWARRDREGIFWATVLSIEQIQESMSDPKRIKPHSYWTSPKDGNKPSVCLFHCMYSWYKITGCSPVELDALFSKMINKGK